MTERPPRPQDDHDDDVAALIRLAGERPAVPPVRFARVKANARAQWEHEVRSRRRPLVTWTTAGLAAAAALVLLVTLRILLFDAAPASFREWTVEQVEGDVRRGAMTLRAGDHIDSGDSGDELRTGIDGRVALSLPTGHSLRIDQRTELLLAAVDRLELMAGAIYVDSGSGSTDPVTIRTPFGDVEEIGTQFEVHVDGETLRVRLREGEVMVRRDGARHRVGAGNELEVDASGGIRRAPIEVFGDAWTWVDGLVAMPDLDGESARVFLDWMARQHGWRLVFLDSATAAAAERTTVSGDLRGLTPDEALRTVLRTCGLTHRLEGGDLAVEQETH